MAGPTDVDAYLAALPDQPRAALQGLRETIKAVVPDATETISYQMPTFKLNGRFLVSYAAFKDHCSLFPLSGQILETLGDQVKPYAAGKGTIRFTADNPIPPALVKKIVRVRVKENEAAKPR